MRNLSIFILVSIIGFSACIKDDFVDDFTEAELRITTVLDTLAFDTEFQFEATFLNNVGEEEAAMIEWMSDNEQVISINQEGLAMALSEGSATITARYIIDAEEYIDSVEVAVGASTVVTVQSIESSIATTSSYVLEGDFSFTETADGVSIAFKENYEASQALPGLFVYLSNNRNSVASALEIGAVEVFSGSHTYDVSNVDFSDYKYLVYFCKPFNVKVGDGEF